MNENVPHFRSKGMYDNDSNIIIHISVWFTTRTCKENKLQVIVFAVLLEPKLQQTELPHSAGHPRLVCVLGMKAPTTNRCVLSRMSLPDRLVDIWYPINNIELSFY